MKLSFTRALFVAAALALASQMALASPKPQGPSNTSGMTPFRVLSAVSTGTTTVTRPLTLYQLSMSDEHASTDFHVKLYNKATAATSSDTPVYTYFVNAQTARDIAFPNGAAFSAGLSIRCVTEAADNGTTAAGSNECEVSGTYK